MSSPKVLRYVTTTAVFALVANLAGCMHTSCCSSGCGVGLGQPVAAPGWQYCGPPECGSWTANVTLFDRPSFNWCQKGQSCCTGAPMPDWVANNGSMKAPAGQPKMAGQPMMQESKKVASWMMPPVTPTVDATTIATAGMTTAEKADVKPQALGTGSSSMMVMDPMDGAKSRGPIRRAIRRGMDRIQGNPTTSPASMDFGMPAANAERIEKMPKEVEAPEVTTTGVKPVAFETTAPPVIAPSNECSVSLQVFDLEDSVQQGSETAYLVQLVNEGADEAKDLTIAIHCPTNLRPISVLNAQQQSIEGQNVKVQVGDLAAGKTRIVRLNLKAMQAGDGKVAVTVTGKSLPGHLMAEDVIKVVR